MKSPAFRVAKTRRLCGRRTAFVSPAKDARSGEPRQGGGGVAVRKWVGGHVPPMNRLRCGWFHPQRRGGHGVPLLSRRSRARRTVVRAEGLEPSRAVKLNGFSYRLRLSPPGRDVSGHARQVCGLDYPFTIPRNIRGLGAARLVSTPSRLECSGRAWLGSAISGFPEFGQFCIAGFPGEHSSFLKSVASAGSATPAWPVATIDAHYTLAKGNLRREV